MGIHNFLLCKRLGHLLVTIRVQTTCWRFDNRWNFAVGNVSLQGLVILMLSFLQVLSKTLILVVHWRKLLVVIAILVHHAWLLLWSFLRERILWESKLCKSLLSPRWPTSFSRHFWLWWRPVLRRWQILSVLFQWSSISINLFHWNSSLIKLLKKLACWNILYQSCIRSWSQWMTRLASHLIRYNYARWSELLDWLFFEWFVLYQGSAASLSTL